MTLINLLTDDERTKTRTIPLGKGQILFHEGDVCDGVFVVEKGQIKISAYALSGTEIIFNAIEPGGVFGNNLVFASDPTFRGSVIAMSETTLAFIPREVLVEILQTNESFLREYLRIQSDFGKTLNAKIKLLSLASAEERFMLYLQIYEGRIIYKSISALADSLFLQRETLSRLIHRLADEGKIAIEGKTIIQLTNSN